MDFKAEHITKDKTRSLQNVKRFGSQGRLSLKQLKLYTLMTSSKYIK